MNSAKTFRRNHANPCRSIATAAGSRRCRNTYDKLFAPMLAACSSPTAARQGQPASATTVTVSEDRSSNFGH